MRVLVILLSVLLANGSWGQISRRQAEEQVASMNGVLSVPRETMIWSMTAPDRELVRALSSGDDNKGMAAAMEMGARHRPALTTALANALPGADAKVGTSIVGALSRNPAPIARRAVEAAVKHRVEKVRWAAGIASATWGFKDAHVALADAVRHGQFEAVEPLGRVGSAGDIPALRAFYSQASHKPYPGYGPRHDRTALLSLARLGDRSAIAQLRAEVDHPTDRFFRASAISTLGQLRKSDDLPRFMKALKDPSMNVRFAAVEALGAAQAKKALPALEALAARPGSDAGQGKSSDESGRRYVAYVAENIRAGRRSLTLREWNQTARYARRG